MWSLHLKHSDVLPPAPTTIVGGTARRRRRSRLQAHHSSLRQSLLKDQETGTSVVPGALEDGPIGRPRLRSREQKVVATCRQDGISLRLRCGLGTSSTVFDACWRKTSELIFGEASWRI